MGTSSSKPIDQRRTVVDVRRDPRPPTEAFDPSSPKGRKHAMVEFSTGKRYRCAPMDHEALGAMGLLELLRELQSRLQACAQDRKHRNDGLRARGMKTALRIVQDTQPKDATPEQIEAVDEAMYDLDSNARWAKRTYRALFKQHMQALGQLRALLEREERKAVDLGKMVDQQVTKHDENAGAAQTWLEETGAMVGSGSGSGTAKKLSFK
jgi:hypothetical protein